MKKTRVLYIFFLLALIIFSFLFIIFLIKKQNTHSRVAQSPENELFLTFKTDPEIIEENFLQRTFFNSPKYISKNNPNISKLLKKSTLIH